MLSDYSFLSQSFCSRMLFQSLFVQNLGIRLDYCGCSSNESFSVVISPSRKWLQCAWLKIKQRGQQPKNYLSILFLKNAKPLELTIKSILTDLPPLWDRVKALQVCFYVFFFLFVFFTMLVIVFLIE